MNQINFYKFTSVVLIIFAIFSFFSGFYLDEIASGAAGYEGDFKHVFANLEFFLKNDLMTSISNPEYHDSRPPTPYILHELLNPFAGDKVGFRKTVFFISLLAPLLFYLCLRQKFEREENLLLILIASTIFLSPFFRMSSFWGTQENYGLIFLLLTFLFLGFFGRKNEESSYKEYINLFAITFFSSLCIYFDQKLVIIPIICFLKIILSKKTIKAKTFSILCYFIFSLPYIYLMMIWGSIIPSDPTSSRQLGKTLYLDHFGYASTMIAFYLFPILLFKGKKLLLLVKNLFLDKKNYLLIILFFIYLVYLTLFFKPNPDLDLFLGKGFIHKISFLLFGDYLYRSIFIYFSFLVSWLIIMIYCDKNYREYFVVGYFSLLSIIIWPIFQEYFDPLILILVFTFFNTKIYPNYKNSIALFVYLLIFLLSTNVYYSDLLN